MLATLLEELLVPKFNYWIYIVLMMIGLYAMIAKNNLIKKLIGMSIFQTAIILFYVSHRREGRRNRRSRFWSMKWFTNGDQGGARHRPTR